MLKEFALVACLLSGFTAGPVFAMTVSEVVEHCPLDGFEFTAELPMSGTSFGMMLDMKPVGPIAAPWWRAECPQDGLVLYREFSEPEVDRLHGYVASPEYRLMLENDTQYWRIAHLMEFLGESEEAIAWAYLQATWEAGDVRYASYAAKALDAYAKALDGLAGGSEAALTNRLVQIELLRRLGRFEQADAAARQLLDMDVCQKTDFCRELGAKQQGLISDKSTRPEPAGD